jgi:hypothetical protein
MLSAQWYTADASDTATRLPPALRISTGQFSACVNGAPQSGQFCGLF